MNERATMIVCMLIETKNGYTEDVFAFLENIKIWETYKIFSVKRLSLLANLCKSFSIKNDQCHASIFLLVKPSITSCYNNCYNIIINLLVNWRLRNALKNTFARRESFLTENDTFLDFWSLEVDLA